jgi:hypothetical protein
VFWGSTIGIGDALWYKPVGMRREPVQSGTIRSVGYDPTAQILEVEFQQGGTFRYFSVPEFLHRGLMLADSKGAFFNRRLLGRYQCEQIA